VDECHSQDCRVSISIPGWQGLGMWQLARAPSDGTPVAVATQPYLAATCYQSIMNPVAGACLARPAGQPRPAVRPGTRLHAIGWGYLGYDEEDEGIAPAVLQEVNMLMAET